MLRTLLSALLMLAWCLAVSAQDRPVFSDVIPYAIDLQAEMVDREGMTTTVDALLDGKSAIVHVWATWCAPCREELPELAEFLDDPGHQTLAERVLVVSLDSADSAHVFSFLYDDLGPITLPSWHATDGRRRLSASLRLRGMPATYVIDGKGQIIAFRAGPLDWLDPDMPSALARRLGLP